MLYLTKVKKKTFLKQQQKGVDIVKNGYINKYLISKLKFEILDALCRYDSIFLHDDEDL